jgi:aminoglycoside phosphotransferase family enzyme/predicted kinase
LTLDPLRALVDRLCNARGFAHPAAQIERVETHISWVVLAGDYAYKFKKPLDLGFLDFSTLEKRRAACEDEVRLNRRLAPGLYIDVLAITGTPDDPSMGGNGPAIEYAVRMRRFDRACELDRLLAADALPVERIDELARLVARFHDTLPPATAEGPHGTPQVALANADANFEHVLELEHAPDIVGRITALRRWTQSEHARVAPRMTRRLREGWVRECHGDLHLANMVLHENEVVVFDCIEFNPALRWIDVMAEIAFTVMDLRHRGRLDYAQRFLNDYLEASGDYAGLAVLRFYLVYRAMVRAKIAAIRAPQETSAATRARSHAEFRAYLTLAEVIANPEPPAMVITCGPSGSGKSHLAAKLACTGEWIRIRSDVERRRLSGLDAGQRSGAGLGAGMYAAPMGRRTYARLLDLAHIVVKAGFPVIVDATFLARTQRDAFRALAASLGVPFAILKPRAPVAVMRERVVARADAGGDASEATVAVLERQLAQAQPLAADEEALAVEFDNRGSVDVARLAAAVRMRLSG